MGVEISIGGERPGPFVLRLSGGLRPGWCGNLSAGLATRGIDITAGHARREGPGDWASEFLLAGPGLSALSRAEVEALLERDAGAAFSHRIRLSHYTLARSAAHGGCLELDVEGFDEIGFLASLLRRLAFFSLFPVELRLRSTADRARDRLWIQSPGAQVPPDRSRAALAASLDGLVIGRHRR